MDVTRSAGIDKEHLANGNDRTTNDIGHSVKSSERNAWSSPGSAAFDFRSTLTFPLLLQSRLGLTV